VLALTAALLLQAVAPPGIPAPDSTTPVLHLRPFSWTVAPDSGRRPVQELVEYSDLYGIRADIHRVASWAMLPLFAGSAYTGFQLRSKGVDAPQWVRDLHGPLAGGTAVLFGLNTLTGVWNLIEGRRDPVGRSKRLLHGALFLAAGAGFAYVTAAGDNIHASGRPNRWHRDVALGSMTVSVVSWALMALFD
jgi:hypothetical protein